MSDGDSAITPTDLVDGALAGGRAESVALGFDPAEVETARRVRLITAELRAAEVELPPDFEARLMLRVRQDEALLDVLELGLSGFGRALVELVNLLLSFLPLAAPERQPALA